MAYYTVRVTNTGTVPRMRGGHIFPPTSTSDMLVVRDVDLPELRACEGLTVEVIGFTFTHPSLGTIGDPAPGNTGIPAQTEDEGGDVTDAVPDEAAGAEPEPDERPITRGGRGRRTRK